jgi:hypothetical protein
MQNQHLLVRPEPTCVIGITDSGGWECDARQRGQAIVPKKSLETAISKLAIAGEQAGFSVDEMIGFLNAGLSVEGLFDLIALRLEKLPELYGPRAVPCGWIV